MTNVFAVCLLSSYLFAMDLEQDKLVVSIGEYPNYEVAVIVVTQQAEITLREGTKESQTTLTAIHEAQAHGRDFQVVIQADYVLKGNIWTHKVVFIPRAGRPARMTGEQDG